MNILVVDDEPLARERLLRLLSELQPQAHCLQAAGGEEALALAARQPPDLVLLDIRMPEMDGLEVAARLDMLPQPPAVVFCTAYDEYALAALKHHAVAYLLKPARTAELADALVSAGRVNRLQLAQLGNSAQIAESAPRREVSSQTHRGLETLAIAEIRLFVAGQKYVTAIAPAAELVLQDTLKELEDELQGRFLRVHRNALVSLAHVRRLLRDAGGGWSVELDGIGQTPAISRRHVAQVKRSLQQR